MNHTTAIILCAGMGSRLKPMTDHTPKCLLEVGAQTLLKRLIGQLDEAGFKKKVIVGGHLSKKIAAYLREEKLSEVLLIDNPDYEKTNNAVSLGLALQNCDGGFLIVDGDLWLEEGILKALADFPQENAIVGDPDPTRLTGEAMKVLAGCKAEVLKLSKNLSLDEAWGEYIGLARLDKKWAQALSKIIGGLDPKDRENCYYEDVINRLIPTLPALHLFSTQGRKWTEIDSPEDLAEAQRLI